MDGNSSHQVELNTSANWLGEIPPQACNIALNSQSRLNTCETVIEIHSNWLGTDIEASGHSLMSIALHQTSIEVLLQKLVMNSDWI